MTPPPPIHSGVYNAEYKDVSLNLIKVITGKSNIYMIRRKFLQVEGCQEKVDRHV